MRATRLIDRISLEQKSKEYNPAKVLIDLDNPDAKSDGINRESSLIQLLAETSIIAIYQTIKSPDAIDKICTLCAGSKFTQIVI